MKHRGTLVNRHRAVKTTTPPTLSRVPTGAVTLPDCVRRPPPTTLARPAEAHPYHEDRRVIYASCCLGATSVLLAVLYLLHVL